MHVLFNCSQQGHFAWWQSLSEVQGTVWRHPPSHRASWRVPPHTPCREALFRVSQVLRHDNPKLNRRTTTIVRFGTSFGKIVHWRNLPGEICWRNLSGEICRRNLLANLPAKCAGEICGGICRRNFRRNKFGKDKPDFRRKTTPKNFTCKLHRSQNVPSTHPKNPARFLRGRPEGAAQVKGLCVFKLCRLQRQASGTKRGTKVGVLCYLCSHVSLVGLSLRNCTRWPLGLGPSNSRLQKEYSVVARVSQREGRYGFNDFGGARNQGESPLPMDIRGGNFKF